VGSPIALPLVTTQVPQTWSGGDPRDDRASTWTGDPVVNYRRAQNPLPYDSGVGSMSQFMMEDEDDTSPLGLAVRQDQRRLKSGEEATGLLVLTVSAGGPAATAGVKGLQRKVTTTLETVTMGASLAFPYAALLMPIFEAARIGEHYDLIIGVDGYRVTSVLDFQDCMRDLQPGQIVYLSVVRDGDRVQVPVTMSSVIAQQ
jgi:S1-C subfamily serine protease